MWRTAARGGAGAPRTNLCLVQQQQLRYYVTIRYFNVKSTLLQISCGGCMAGDLEKLDSQSEFLVLLNTEKFTKI